jgi:hypothetical protein
MLFHVRPFFVCFGVFPIWPCKHASNTKKINMMKRVYILTITKEVKTFFYHMNPRVFSTIFFKMSKLLPKLVDIAA